ncbi:hypothetical protein [Thiohalobacter sp.]|uniref:hypothetical protein n=1 Tax=Thiohalobacter sp. TaxID=2025948 RepID=UPI00262EC702|nr:hypothetical protein [Thiohalobacter sp.]
MAKNENEEKGGPKAAQVLAGSPARPGIPAGEPSLRQSRRFLTPIVCRTGNTAVTLPAFSMEIVTHSAPGRETDTGFRKCLHSGREALNQ